MGALSDFTIGEVSRRIAGSYAAKLLADFGAAVIKIEPPGGCPTRTIAPLVNGVGVAFSFANTNKKSVVLDIEAETGQAALHRLLARADAFITDVPPDEAEALGIGNAQSRELFPHLVHCTISPFGARAPAHLNRLRPLQVANAGGWAYHTPSEASPDSPPLMGAGVHMTEFESGLEAAIALSASLWRKRSTGRGQWIDVSEVATQVSRADCVLGRMLAGEQEPGPERTRYDMGGPGTTFTCADGHVFLLITTKMHWQGLCQLMDMPQWAEEFPVDWLEFHCTADRIEAFRQKFSDWLLTQAKRPICEAAQKLGVPLVEVNTARDLPQHPQYRHRGYFQTLDGVAYPTVPYRMSASPVRLRTPAPALGADQEIVQ